MLFLKENHEIALYVACGDITDVSISGEIMTIKVLDSTMLAVLNEGKRKIERALNWQGFNFEVNIEQKIIPLTKDEEDIKTLKKIFEDKLTIKN